MDSSASCQNEFLKMYNALRDPLLHEQPSELLRACLGKDADNFEQQRQKFAQNDEDSYGWKWDNSEQEDDAAEYAAQQREQFLWPRL